MADKLVQQNFNEIIIDDGSVKVPIRNKHGEQIGEFSFRPTDIGMEQYQILPVQHLEQHQIYRIQYMERHQKCDPESGLVRRRQQYL